MVIELRHEQKQVTIFCNNQSAIYFNKNQIHHEKTKYINIKLYFIRLEVLRGVINSKKIHTDDNVVATLTILGAKFEHCLRLVRIYRN